MRPEPDKSASPQTSASPAKAHLHAVGDEPVTPAAAVGGALCVDCGHGAQAHEHYRRGSDCALCDCAKFRRPRRTLWRRTPR